MLGRIGWARVGAIGMVALVGLTACGSGGGAQQKPSSSPLTIGIPEEPDTLDPQKTNAAITRTILHYAGDSLVSIDTKGKVVPSLATSWSVGANGLSWTFTLRKGVKFQNGDSMTADAVKASFERALDPATKAGVAASLLEPVKKVSTVGTDKVRIALKSKYSLLLENLADPAASIVDAKAAKSEGKNFGRTPVLTGPWRITQWKSGDRINLERNAAYAWGPAYAGKGAPKIKQLTFRVIPDDATRVSALRSNEIQGTTALPPANVKSFTSNSQYTTYKYLRDGVGLFLEFNVTKPPFDDIRVRRAFNYAIDPNAVVKVALLGQGRPACGPLPPSIEGYWPGICSYHQKPDLAKAKTLLAQAGWKPGADGKLEKNGKPFTFTLFSTNLDTWTNSAQLVQQQLKRLGITVKIQNFEFGTLLSNTQHGKDVAHFMGYTYNTPDILYLWFKSSNIGTGLNLSHVKDPKLDALLDRYRGQMDAKARDATYQEIQKYIVDQALWVPLWVEDDHIVTTSKLKGAQLSGLGYLILNRAQLVS